MRNLKLNHNFLKEKCKEANIKYNNKNIMVLQLYIIYYL